MQQGTRGREPVAQAAHVGPRERLQSMADQRPSGMALATARLAIETRGVYELALGLYRIRRRSADARAVACSGDWQLAATAYSQQLGLPLDSRLSPKDALAFRAFEDTDIKLKKSFPNHVGHSAAVHGA